MANLIVEPARSLQGEIIIPGDKSVSHRAFLLGALARGPSRILYGLASDDVERSRRAIEQLGVVVRRDGEAWIVDGKGSEAFRAPGSALDMGNSGTTTRLLMGILAGCPFETKLFGDESLSKRPMRRVTEPLQKMGAVIRGENGADHLPLTIRGGKLKGMLHAPLVPSAQVKSALLLAGLSAEGPTSVVEPVPTRDHTERMLRYMGAKIEIHGGLTPRGQTPTAVTVEPGSLQAREIEVPGDFSSAAFFLAAAAIVPGSSVTVRRVGLNPTRTALLDLLRRMGAKIAVIPAKAGIKVKTDPRVRGDDGEWEPVGDLTVSYTPLKGIEVDPAVVPNAIDELPILMVAATQAKGETQLKGVGELRVKETDRILSMVEGLAAMGADIRSVGDDVFINGPKKLKGAAVDSFGDHRTAMALAIAGLAARGKTTVQGGEWVSISFPDFEEKLRAVRAVRG